MALNLKRKRAQPEGPRKVRRITPPEDEAGEVTDDEIDADAGSDDDEENEEDDGPEPPQNDQSSHGRFKPPTGGELREMKDASDLFKSSTFKLQIDALLPNVRPKPSRIPPLERFLMNLYAFLSKLPSVSPQHPLQASRSLLKKGVSVPYPIPLPSEDTKWKVAFEPPADITLAGSWANKLSIKGKDGSKFGVDLAVEMPGSLFQEKDYSNGRFFHKRAFYLATIAAALTDSKKGLKGVDVVYHSQSDDTRLTKLVIYSDEESENGLKKLNAQINIIPVLPANSPLTLSRLSPTHSSTHGAPTPHYNASLLTSLTPKPHLLAAHNLKNTSPAFADALSLLRVWANQRGYGEGTKTCVRGFDGKGPFWAALLDVVINGQEVKGKRKPLGKGLSSYQLFRAALDFLAKHDWVGEPVFANSGNKDGLRFSRDSYASSEGEGVFVDSSSPGVNLLSGVPVGSLRMLSHDAKSTLDLLNSSSDEDSFTPCFLKDHRDLSTRFDGVLRVDLSSARLSSSSTSVVDFGSPTAALLASLTDTLSRGLGDRAKAIVLLQPSPSTRPLSQAHPSTPHILHIGLVYNEAQASRQVDHGPAAAEEEGPELQAFRELWGDKAELRRFKDGRINESVVWDVRTLDEKFNIPLMIVRHLLKLHFSVEDVDTWQGAFDPLIRLPEEVPRPQGVIGFKGALAAYDKLVKSIKALDDDKLPLSLLNISATSESLRYTGVFAPIPSATLNPPIELVLQFEKSSRWPDDLKAIQVVKLAFFEKIARELMAAEKVVARIVLPPPSVSNVEDGARLEVVFPEGWTFHARIWHDREVTLLNRIIEEKTKKVPPALAALKPKEDVTTTVKEAAQAKQEYLRSFIHSPPHHRAVAKLAHRFTAYPGTVRLVKRWLASHWILGEGAVSTEVVEIICAKFFLYPGWEQEDEEDKGKKGESVPASKERGFALVVEFLSEWKWEEGVYVSLYSGTPAPSDAEGLVAGKGVWRVKTEMDPEGIAWTGEGPDAAVARRVQSIAKASWECLSGIGEGRAGAVVKSLFTHPTDAYDVLIHLDPAVLPRYPQHVAPEQRYLKTKKRGDKDLAGLDPARAFFLDLQRVYADTFKIFHDPFGGDRFGIVWDPSLKIPKQFRVLGGFSSAPCPQTTKKDKDVKLNEEGILGELERMGRGLVKGVSVQV